MSQEFTINSQAIETKINQLLPSQGGFGAGVDFSASTMVIPIVDLTETAEGSQVRVDLQTALSHTTCTEFVASSTSVDILSTTGYYRVLGTWGCNTDAAGNENGKIIISDGTTDKIVWRAVIPSGTLSNNVITSFDIVCLIKAGDTLKVETANSSIQGSVRQIADLSGNLTNP